MPPINSFAQPMNGQLEAHEDRLQRAEANSEETRIQVAELKTSVEYQQQTINRNHADLSDKLDEGFSRLGVVHEKILTTLSDHEETLEKHTASLKEYDDAKGKRTARKTVLKNLILAGLMAAGGAIGKMAIDWLAVWWH